MDLEGIAQHYTPFLLPFGPLELATGPVRPGLPSRQPSLLEVVARNNTIVEALTEFAKKRPTHNQAEEELLVYLVDFPVMLSRTPVDL